MKRKKKVTDSINKMVILCVDDEETVLISLKNQLKLHFRDKFRYEMATNANDALDAIQELVGEENLIILIVSDWLMPGMKGDEFLIQVHKMYPKIVTVMLTGFANTSAIENAKKNANLLTCIAKPWSEEDLVDVVNKATQDYFK